jgi:hypothetical protein
MAAMSRSIEHWLESIGIAKYTAMFSEIGIDLDIVDELKEGDLEKLGISLGDRKRFLRAPRRGGRPYCFERQPFGQSRQWRWLG